LSVCSDMFDISGDHTVHSGTLKRRLELIPSFSASLLWPVGE